MKAPLTPVPDAVAALLDEIRQRHAQLAPEQKGEIVASTAGTARSADAPGRLAPPVSARVREDVIHPMEAFERGGPSAESKQASPAHEMERRTTGTGMAEAGARGLVQANAHALQVPDRTPANLQARLETFGLLPAHANRIAHQVAQLHPRQPPDELAAVAAVLGSVWREPRHSTPGPAWHVFVGAPGAGKTTCLCKWLAQTVLLAGCPARVWRLDGLTANTAESLSVLAEVFGVPLNRAWPTGAEADDDEAHFVDLPGVDWQESAAVEDLAQRLQQFSSPRIHLVLNAAYSVPLLLAQVETFACLPLTDLVFTHLDEEPRRGRLWNFVLGTKFAVGFLSAGQNVPGEYRAASLEQLLPRQLP